MRIRIDVHFEYMKIKIATPLSRFEVLDRYFMIDTPGSVEIGVFYTCHRQRLKLVLSNTYIASYKLSRA
jgi:hypothetical protein